MVSDLHAADAKYHVDCRNTFMSARNIEFSKPKNEEDADLDFPYEETISALLADKERMWSSVELHNMYTDNGGTKLSRSNLIKALKEQFNDLVVLSAPGYAHVITFPPKAASILRLCYDDDDEELNAAITKVAKHIKSETLGIENNNKEKYNLHISHENVLKKTSVTLMKLCSALSPKLDKTPLLCLLEV